MIKTIDREELKKKIENRGESFHLIEVLADGPYKAGHIKGAINIPFKQVGTEAKRRFNKDDEIVVYCADAECTASDIAAEKLDSLGFTSVYDYHQGKEDWKEAGYPIVEGDSPE